MNKVFLKTNSSFSVHYMSRIPIADAPVADGTEKVDKNFQMFVRHWIIYFNG